MGENLTQSSSMATPKGYQSQQSSKSNSGILIIRKNKHHFMICLYHKNMSYKVGTKHHLFLLKLYSVCFLFLNKMSIKYLWNCMSQRKLTQDSCAVCSEALLF